MNQIQKLQDAFVQLLHRRVKTGEAVIPIYYPPRTTFFVTLPGDSTYSIEDLRNGKVPLPTPEESAKVAVVINKAIDELLKSFDRNPDGG